MGGCPPERGCYFPAGMGGSVDKGVLPRRGLTLKRGCKRPLKYFFFLKRKHLWGSVSFQVGENIAGGVCSYPDLRLQRNF